MAQQTGDWLQMGNGIGLCGKIPGCGDFVQRRLPTSLVNKWMHWFQSGLAARQFSTQNDGCYSLIGAPMWNFVIPATLGIPFAQLGCLLPSQDRVGRHYPIFAMWLVSPEYWEDEYLVLATERYYSIRRILQCGIYQRHSIERIDHALQALPPLPCFSRQRCDSKVEFRESITVSDFDPLQYSSFWWEYHGNGKTFDTYIHSGNLTVQLFHHLFKPVGDIRYMSLGLYKKMFD